MKVLRLARPNRRQTGDTIVEVLIAMVVVAIILAGAFAVASRSSRAVRDSEEHAQALNLLQAQVELLRSAAGTPGAITSCARAGSALPCNLSVPFCLDVSGHYAASDPHCTLNSLYAVAITSPTAAASTTATTTFNLSATWGALGGGTARVGLSYKVQVSR